MFRIQIALVLFLTCLVSLAGAQVAHAATTSEEQEILEQEAASAHISELVKVVDQLTKSSLYCGTVQDCIAMPMGSRTCGGPASYVVASELNPSLDAVIETINLVTEKQQELNVKFRIMSRCSIEMAPALACNANICEAVR